MTRAFFTLLLLILLPAATCAQRQNTIRKGLKPVKQKVAEVAVAAPVCDTVLPRGGEVRFSGYEKTLRATRETVFVSNLADRDVARVMFTVTYLDASGRQLHVVRKNVAVEIPAGETRRIDFPTWDRQFAFYYKRSPRPRVSAIPYDVKIVADTLVYLQNKSHASH